VSGALVAASIVLAKRNPGALQVCLRLAEQDGAFDAFLALNDLGFRGSDIWVAFKDFAGEDLGKLQAGLASKDPAMVAAVEAVRR
jgi:hypothetical protein